MSLNNINQQAGWLALLVGLLGLGWLLLLRVLTISWGGDPLPGWRSLFTADGVLLVMGFCLLSYLVLRYVSRSWRTQAGQFETFFVDNPQPMLIYEEGTLNFLAANRAAQTTYGYDEASFLKLRIQDIHPPEDQQRLNRKLQNAQPTRTGLGRHLNREGQLFQVKVSSHQITFGGKAARLVIVAPIGDRKRDEQQITQLHQQLAEFRFAIARAIIMATIDEEGNFIEVNENLVRVSGYDKTTLLTSPFSLTFDEDQPKLADIMTTLGDHRIWRGEIRHRQPKGDSYWTQSFFIPFHQEKGRLTYAVVIHTEITERKRSEEASLRREEYLRSLVQSQSNFLIRTDRKGLLTFVNRQFEDSSSYLPGATIGQPFAAAVLEADQAALCAMIETCVAKPGQIVPLRLRKGQDSEEVLYTDWEFTGIQNEQGEVVEIQGVGVDVTARLAAERQILDQNERLREIAWVSSHRLRRPVANIIGLVNLIKHTPEQTTDFIEPLEFSAQELDVLIHDIVQKTYEVEDGPLHGAEKQFKREPAAEEPSIPDE